MALMWMGMLGAFVLGSHGVLWLDESLTVSLAREDGPFEYATAAIFLVASLSAAVLFARSESGNDLRLFRTRRNVFYLLLSLLFAFGAGEEISWGQRIIEFDTPEAIRRINVNGEFNIHNLWLFDRRGTAAHSESPLLVFLAMAIDRMFSMFWLTYCVLIPILNHAIGRVARFARHINLPIPPIWIGVLFPINYLCSRIHPPWVYDGLYDANRPPIEVKEFVFSALFLAIIAFWALGTKSTDPVVPHNSADQSADAARR